MPSYRSLGLVSSLAFAVLGQGLVAQDMADVPESQIHPKTTVSFGLLFGNESLETNTGDPDRPRPVVSRTNSTVQFRLRAERFGDNGLGFTVGGYIGSTDDINSDLGTSDSSLDSAGLFVGLAYRATMSNKFRIPVRFGPFVQALEYDDVSFTDALEYSTLGLRLEAEPEFILFQRPDASGQRVSELSVFASVGCGAGPTDYKDGAIEEEGYAFTFSYEVGVRYRFSFAAALGLSWFGQKYHIGASESYDNDTVFFGIDNDVTGIMVTLAARF